MHRTTRRSRAAALGVLTGLALTLAAPAVAATPPEGTCTDPTGVTVVVDLTDLGGAVEVGCADSPATGTEALQSAGFTDTRDASGMICAIDGLPDPCPATFEGSYWSYWYAQPGGEWTAYLEGSDTAVPAAGSVEGWRYNDGTAGPGIVPPGPATEGEASASDESAAAPVEESAAPVEITAVTTSAEPADDGLPTAVVAGIGLLAVAGLTGLLIARRRRTDARA
ncbi:MAG TPA: hypothetical protein VN257_10385 [Actinotalea sp.]|nr:hypothetical protein [Actinotalea sp.]